MEKLMVNFLRYSYPILRIKYKKYFKRTLVIDNQNFHLSDKNSQYDAYQKLFTILEIVFNEKKEKIEPVLKEFLNVR